MILPIDSNEQISGTGPKKDKERTSGELTPIIPLTILPTDKGGNIIRDNDSIVERIVEREEDKDEIESIPEFTRDLQKTNATFSSKIEIRQSRKN